MADCGAEEKIYDEIGTWADSITCHLDKGHAGNHEGSYSWETDEQLMANFNLANKRLRASRKKRED